MADVRNLRPSPALAAALLVAMCLLLPSEAAGQSAETDVGEVAISGGGIAGLGTHPAAAGSTGLALGRYGMLLIETGYSPLGTRTLRPMPSAPSIDASHLYDFDLAVHIRVPVRDRWAPYGILGGGLLWNTFTQNAAGPQGQLIRSSSSTLDFGFETGGGLRYYIRDNWGIRPELKVVVSRQTYTRFSIGVFYVFSEPWQ